MGVNRAQMSSPSISSGRRPNVRLAATQIFSGSPKGAAAERKNDQMWRWEWGNMIARQVLVLIPYEIERQFVQLLFDFICM